MPNKKANSNCLASLRPSWLGGAGLRKVTDMAAAAVVTNLPFCSPERAEGDKVRLARKLASQWCAAMYSPVWLKVVCIVSIVLGALGLLMAATGLIGQWKAEDWQKSTAKLMEAVQAGGVPPQIKELQQEMMDQTIAVQRRWLPINVAVSTVHLLVAAVLLAGGIQALRLKPSGRKLLLAALSLAIVFEVVRIVPTSMMQWQMSKIIEPFMQKTMEAAAPPGKAMPAAQRKSIQMVMRASMMAGLLIGVLTAAGMAIVKLAFYIAGIWLLRRPQFQAMYEPAAAAAVS